MTAPIFGIVARFDGRYFTIEAPDAPAHLRTLFLVRTQMRGAAVGDSVRLDYRTTARSGLWNVTEVISTAAARQAAALAELERRFWEVTRIRQEAHYRRQPVDPAITREWHDLAAGIAMAKRLLDERT